MKDFMFINSWNKETHVPYWKSEYCNRINGTGLSSNHITPS